MTLLLVVKMLDDIVVTVDALDVGVVMRRGDVVAALVGASVVLGLALLVVKMLDVVVVEANALDVGEAVGRKDVDDVMARPVEHVVAAAGAYFPVSHGMQRPWAPRKWV